ncbi:predicted protein [Nematostella vectensis]|uniref:Protein N-lysine methyltransferase METTL21A n=2 Tax=Nematostella vectensis TaxID=45351 RepID=A7SYC8_NEMVE|nr:predicted protein [Nematostella vectensis]|eukprot:XP_001623378.1 predicted protein [Nematostella vectensis]
MALVPFKPHLTLATFHKKDRSLTFAGQTLTIYQDWNDGGVAAVLWDAAIILSRYLEQNKELVHQKRIIELGAGTGLVGMVAGLLGGRDVLITDRKSALSHTRLNIEENRKSGLQDSLQVKELVWGQDVSDLSPPFDVILGADIIYIEDTFNDLLRTLRDLSGKETIVLISCKIRYERDSNFLKMMKQDFDINQVLYNKDLDITVYMAKRIFQKREHSDL